MWKKKSNVIYKFIKGMMGKSADLNNFENEWHLQD